MVSGEILGSIIQAPPCPAHSSGNRELGPGERDSKGKGPTHALSRYSGSLALLGMLGVGLLRVEGAHAEVYFQGSWRTRVEAWRWFEVPGYQSRYAYGHSLFRLGLHWHHGPHEAVLEVAGVALLHVPTRAVAPSPAGQLGPGGTLQAVNGGRDASVFPKQFFYRWRSGSLTLQVGRWEFSDGTEGSLDHPRLVWIRQSRIAHRILGPFSFSPVQRSFDGLLGQYHRPWGTVTALVAWPTRGVFDLRAYTPLTRVVVGYGSLVRGWKSASGVAEGRLFSLTYFDDRDVLKPDNRPLAERTADSAGVHIVTVGTHGIVVRDGRPLRWDGMLWAAAQWGRWGRLRHAAYAVALEGGVQVDGPGDPWIRVGAFMGSGDADPRDGTHGTFIPGPNTPRPYALIPFYNLSNLMDGFVQVLWAPHRRVRLRADLHRLVLHRAADLWYGGGGPYDERTWGVVGRPSSGRRGLATVVDGSLTVTLGRGWRLEVYHGTAWAGPVLWAVYPQGGRLHFTFLEAHRGW